MHQDKFEVLQIESPILNLLLLVLKILLDLNLDVSHGGGGSSKVLLEKAFEFISNKRDDTIAFNLDLLLLPTKVDFILEERDCKKNVLRAYSISCVEMIFALLAEIVVLHIGATIVQIRVLGLKSSILGGGICFAMFLTHNK